MKILRYEYEGLARTGALTEGGVVDLSAEAFELDDLRSAVSPDGQQRIAHIVSTSQPTRSLDDVVLLTPLHPEARIFCVGRNFRDHVAETRVAETRAAAEHAEPRIFLRTHQSLVGPGGTLERPSSSETFDVEGELAVMIGTAGRSIPSSDALGHVGAFTCFNDGSVRAFQEHTTTAGKNFDRSGAIGPWWVTSDEIGDPRDLELTTRLNAEAIQQATMDMMIYPIARVIEYISLITELLPGDVISTGTPSGVGSAKDPPVWLRDGDRLEVEISRVGTLRMTVGPPRSV
jgi:2-keto-4-pentenoate hydratase/2-oxohepta-3-ene-1,7-dioic acid hydratase in catechol pathway